MEVQRSLCSFMPAWFTWNIKHDFEGEQICHPKICLNIDINIILNYRHLKKKQTNQQVQEEWTSLVVWWKRILLPMQETCRRQGFNPWIGKIPWNKKWQPTRIFLPAKSHGLRSLAGCSHTWLLSVQFSRSVVSNSL